jgi:hypothetical protein
MTGKRTYRLTNLLALIGLSVAPVSAMTMTYDGTVPALFEQITVKFDNQNTNIYAGQLGVRFDSGLTALLFCADPFVALRLDAVSVNPLPGSQVNQGERLAWMFNSYVPSMTQGWQAAAFQLAAWDIVADNGDGLAIGRVQGASTTNAQILTAASALVAASQGKSAKNGIFYEPTAGSRYSQTLFEAPGSDVPEPSTYLLMGAGLLVLSQLRRRG